MARKMIDRQCLSKQVNDIIALSNADNIKEVMNLVREITAYLGDTADAFDVYDFDEATLSYFAEQIESNRYDAFPFVILARYVPKTARERFTKLIFKYGQESDPMDWIMKAEVCRSLPFLNCLPEDSMRYLAKRLGDDGFDDEPFHSAIHAMTLFYEHTDLVMEEISNEIADNRIYPATYFELLAQIITTKSQAEQILPVFEESYMEDYRNMDDTTLSEILSQGTGDCEVSTLFFYGHLNMLAKCGR